MYAYVHDTHMYYTYICMYLYIYIYIHIHTYIHSPRLSNPAQPRYITPDTLDELVVAPACQDETNIDYASSLQCQCCMVNDACNQGPLIAHLGHVQAER